MAAFARLCEEIQRELAPIRFTARTIDRLCADVQQQVAHVRAVERRILQIAVDRCGMPREKFVESFPGHETDLRMDRKHGGGVARIRRRARTQPAGDPGRAAKADRYRSERGTAAAAVEENQPADDGGRVEDAAGEARDDRGQPAPRDLHREEVREPRHALPGSDSGRQYRLDEGGRQVRIPAWLEVFDLRDVVGAPGRDALARGSGAHDSRAGAHDRDDQQAQPHFA